MKVLLIYPNQPAVATQPPLGLMYIASMLRADGHQVQLIEGNAERIYDQFLPWHPGFWHPDFIGITCMTSMYSEIIKMRDYIHSTDPLIPIIFGGVHATILPESLLDPKYPDYVVQGEGELTMLEIVNGLSRPGILQGQSPEPLDDLPFPARDLVNKRYLKHSVSILAARGCPGNCSFCQPTLRKVFGSQLRRRSPNNVRSEMYNCYGRFRVEDFEFFDDTFTADKNWVYDFCDLLDHFFFKWKALSRVDMLDFEILERMKEAGLTKLSLGIESGSQEILNSYSKGTTVEQNDRVLKWCAELGIKVHGFFMIGALEETEKSIEETRQFIRDHKFDSIFVTITTPTPCTRLYDRAEREGRLKVPWSQFNLLGSLTTTGHRGDADQLVPMRLYHLTADQVIKARNRILQEFYLRKARNPLYLLRFIRNNGLDYTWEAAKNVFH